MLGKWQETNETSDWTKGLGRQDFRKTSIHGSIIEAIMFAINCCVSQSTQKTPYEMVFGQAPRQNETFWQEIHRQAMDTSINYDNSVHEENICDLFDDQVCFVETRSQCIYVRSLFD